MREIVNLFSERESRDELDIGQARDAMSDLLWPGTSELTLHYKASLAQRQYRPTGHRRRRACYRQHSSFGLSPPDRKHTRCGKRPE